ncbi:MAG: hypothetical protein HKN32_06170 [Flavobacteriales bacterium]|nr:hypothetical protein [Flavobacteriales bacterium]
MDKVERKCPSCGTWNVQGETHCFSCGEPVAPEAVIQNDFNKRNELRLAKPPNSIERVLRAWKNSPNPLWRALFVVAHTIWLIYAGILAFFLWLVAATPG